MTSEESSSIPAFEPDSIVWVKLSGLGGGCWWPGSVCHPDEAPSSGSRKPPIAVVKFFQEDAYEYVKNINTIYPYDCERKGEFIKKGLDMYRSKHGLHEKFPEDVIRAETATGGDVEILTRDEYQEKKKESYAGLFGGAQKTPTVKGKRGRPTMIKPKSFETPKVSPRITKSRTPGSYKVHYLVQGSCQEKARVDSEPSPALSPASTSKDQATPLTPALAPSTPSTTTPGSYPCAYCPFVSTRLNVMVMHMKSHSYTSYTPSHKNKNTDSTPKSTVKTPKLTDKTPKSTDKTLKSTNKTPKSTVKTTAIRTPAKKKDTPKEKEAKTPKVKKPRKNAKRAIADESGASGAKRLKPDVELDTLLADWEDGEEDSMDQPLAMVADRLPSSSNLSEKEIISIMQASKLQNDSKSNESSPVKTNDSSPLKANEPSPPPLKASESGSCFDFREDDDWPVEKDSERKIPRIKKVERKETEKETDEDVAREVAELLERTTVPELPSAPSSNKFQENFPDVEKAKSPDKREEKKNGVGKKDEGAHQKVIFKTKTFFRSRHSSSQDAIGKYVAKWNAAENLDTADSGDTNGSDAAPSPDARESPPIDQVKVTKLAPKIQFKKMMAEAEIMEKIKEPAIKNVEHFESLHEVITDGAPVYEATPVVDTAIITETIKNVLEKESFNKEASVIDSVVTADTIKKDVERELSTKEDTVDKIQEISYRDKEITGEYEEIIDRNDLLEKQKIFQESKSEQPPNKIPTDKRMTPTPTENPISTFIRKPMTSAPIEKPLSPTCIQNPMIPTSIENPISARIIEEPMTLSIETLMNESTASAVDALLSVSKNNDRLTKHISNDPPEDLFEDDSKYYDNSELNSLNTNGVNLKTIEESNVLNEPIKGNRSTDTSITNFSLDTEPLEKEKIETVLSENVPTESDLQIAQALISLPATAIGRIQAEIPSIETDILRNHDLEKLVDAEIKETELGLNKIFGKSMKENEQTELNKNLNAAQSLVEMSGCIDHSVASVNEIVDTKVSETKAPEKLMALLTDTKVIEPSKSKLLQILEEPPKPRKPVLKIISSTQVITPGKEKILNFGVSQSSSPAKMVPSPPQKQKFIIRHTTANKNILNNLNEMPQDKIVLSRSTKTTCKDGVSTYTIETKPDTKSDSNTIIIQQKMRKVSKPPPKLQKIRPQTTLITSTGSLVQQNTTPQKNIEESMFDINSMPIVLSDELVTAETIEKMPIVFSDGNLVSQTVTTTQPIVQSQSAVNTQPPSQIQTQPSQAQLPKQIQTLAPKQNQTLAPKPQTLSPKQPQVLSSKQTQVLPSKQQQILSPKPTLPKQPSTQPLKLGQTLPKLQPQLKPMVESPKRQTFITKKPEVKTILLNPMSEKSSTPNILSKSKIKKTMLIVKDKQVVNTQADPVVTSKDIKILPAIQSTSQGPMKTEKFILVPASNPNRVRAQKIVIDGSSQKAHVVLGKPVQANSKPSTGELLSTGNEMTMIITNAQGDKTRVSLTPEHKKLLFPNKMIQPQLKTIAARPKPGTPTVSKQQIIVTVPKSQAQPRIVPKQLQHTIITSKGQLILPGMSKLSSTVARSTATSEIRSTVTTSTRTFTPAMTKNSRKTTTSSVDLSNEPMLIIKKPGTNTTTLQLTAAQFEQLQKTGHIIQTAPIQTQVLGEPRVTIQNQVAKPFEESPPLSIVKKQLKGRVQKPAVSSPIPAKKPKIQEIVLPTEIPVPPLAPVHSTPTLLVPTANSLPSRAPVLQNNFSDLDNLEDLLPSTAIQRPLLEPVKLPEPELVQQPPMPDPQSQLLAVPGENFGGPPNSFYLCVEENGTLTPIDNQPLILENNQLVPMVIEDQQLMLMSGDGLMIGAESMIREQAAPQPERRDILAAALANTDVFQPDMREDITPDFRDLNANVSVHCRVSETSTTLNQPIMTPLEVPTNPEEQPLVASTIEDGLAVIGVTAPSVPTSLELPITVTNPRIAPKMTNPLNLNCSTTYHSTGPLPSPGTLPDNTYTPQVVEEMSTGPISMPLLTEDDMSIAKSMPILTDDMAMEGIGSSVELTVSSVDDSPGSADMREVTYPENEEDSTAWSRKLLTPNSDTSELSAEIPIQQTLQFNSAELTSNGETDS